MLAHVQHRFAILFVYIDSALKTCGSDIDLFRSISVFVEIELFSLLYSSLRLSKAHSGRISCCLADFWASASDLGCCLLSYYLLNVCVCVYCGCRLHVCLLSSSRCMHVCASGLFAALAVLWR